MANDIPDAEAQAEARQQAADDRAIAALTAPARPDPTRADLEKLWAEVQEAMRQ